MSSKKFFWESISFASAGLFLSSCYAPAQNFPVASDLWSRSNPEWVEASRTGLLSSKKVLVAVLDTGIDYNHPRLSQHLVPFVTPESSGRNYGIGIDMLGGELDFFPHFSVLEPESGKDLSSELSMRDHGTHVSGLVTLKDSRIGLLPVRVLPFPEKPKDPNREHDPFEGGHPKLKFAEDAVARIGKGVRLACERGARVLNMSLGIDYSGVEESEGIARVESAVAQHLQAPIRTECKDSLLVVAAGNESRVIDQQKYAMPATLSETNILSVGALSSHQEMAYFSNQGRFVDVFIRGSVIKSAIPTDRDDPASVSDSVGKLSGTSMASPLVANLAARVLIEAPDLSPQEVRALILNTADLRELKTQRIPAPEGESYDEGEVGPLPPQLPEKRLGLVANPARALKVAAEVARVLQQGISTAESHAVHARYLTAPFEHGLSPF